MRPIPLLKTFVRRMLGGSSELALLPVGSPAPAFEATDHHGRTVRLSDFTGKRVILWFYPKASTPG